jgi:hypothetical protein
MAKLSKANVVSLATRYHAYLEALYKGDDLGVSAWGDMLCEIQERTGITMCDPSRVKSLAGHARERLAKIEADAAKIETEAFGPLVTRATEPRTAREILGLD